MKTENLYQPFQIEYQEKEEHGKEAHQHTFFELVFIAEGTGIQCINQNSFNFRAGHLFLITPEDCHSLKVLSPCKFLFIRFHRDFLKDNSLSLVKGAVWLKRMEYILQNASHQPGCILHYPGDKAFVTHLAEAIIREYTQEKLFGEEVLFQTVNTLLTVVIRNLIYKTQGQCHQSKGEDTIDLLQYIHRNIYEPEKMRAEVMADHFHVSVSYLGRYFKKLTGEKMQQYITNYRLKLVETRLKHSNMRIHEIAEELHFTDESHLNRLFKKYRGMNPSTFRKFPDLTVKPVNELTELQK